jgi:hypothetical protein
MMMRGTANSLTFAIIRLCHGSVQMIRPELGNHRFNCRERQHFAANFGKSFGATFNANEAVLINADNIAGIIPAISWWL